MRAGDLLTQNLRGTKSCVLELGDVTIISSVGVREWVATIDKALALPVDRFVPGHGFIEQPKASREELVTFQQALRAVIAETRRLHDLGLRADAAVQKANWGPYGEWFLADQQAPIAVNKVYEEIEGKLK